MNLANPEEVTVAEERQNMKQMMSLCKFSIRTLREGITGGMVFPVIGLIYVDKAVRLCYNLSNKELKTKGS